MLWAFCSLVETLFMKRITISLCTALLLAACINDQTTTEAKIASATETKADEAWVPVDSAAAEKAWMEYMTPGPSHQMLAGMDGQWSGEMKMWMSPDAEPMVNQASATFKMIMGGRYQEGQMKGDFLGQPFEGLSTTAYDNAKKVYINTWIDNMGTGIMTMEGKWDAATNTISYMGRMVNPGNGKECDVRELYKIVDENTHHMEMYGPDPKTGKEYKNMEITFTRKK